MYKAFSIFIIINVAELCVKIHRSILLESWIISWRSQFLSQSRNSWELSLVLYRWAKRDNGIVPSASM